MWTQIQLMESQENIVIKILLEVVGVHHQFLLFYGKKKNVTSDRTKYHFYYSDDVWKYSIDLNQWMFLRGRKGQEQKPSIQEQYKYNINNEIGARYRQSTWKIDQNGEIIGIFGGTAYNHLVDGLVYVNDIWNFNVTTNAYKPTLFCNPSANFFFADYSSVGEYGQNNRPGGREAVSLVKINSDEILVVAGYGYFHISKLINGYLADWWIYSSTRNSWKFMGGNLLTLNDEMKYVEKNVYHKNNTIGSRYFLSSVLINEEEVFTFGGYHYDVEKSRYNYAHKYNLTSNCWKYISSSSNDRDSSYSLNKYEYHEDNIPGGRSGFLLVKFNEDEILLFGGAGYTQGNNLGPLSDEWIMNVHTGLWKFYGNKKSLFVTQLSESTAEDSSMYSQGTKIGGIQDFVYEYRENESGDKEIFVFGGTGVSFYEEGFLDICWMKYYGTVCNEYQYDDPRVCSQRGECVSYGECLCDDNFFGDDCEISMCNGILSNESDVCSNKGICIKTQCLCYEYSAYMNSDCSINENLENFMQNLWIYISVSLAVIILLSIFCIIVTFFCVVALKQRKKLEIFDQIEDVDIVLEEQKIARDSTSPKLTINQKLFEIDSKEIKLVKLIGSGGSNTNVYQASYKDQTVAYKLFSVQQYLTENKFTEFEKEVEILASVSFPFILTFYGATLSSQRLGIVMEFADNGDLEYFLLKYKHKNGKSYPIQKKLRMLSEINSAMMFLHGKKIIHRDLKPQNVLVTKNEETKIMDFGLSRFIKEKENERTKTRKIGTSFYMAPEVLKGKYSYPCDIYSFAMLMFVVFSENFSPFGNNSNSLSIVNKNLKPNINDLEGLNISKKIIQLITTNWNSDPSKRMTFEEIGKEIDVIRKKDDEEENWPQSNTQELKKKINALEQKLKEQENEYKEKIRELENQIK